MSSADPADVPVLALTLGKVQIFRVPRGALRATCGVTIDGDGGLHVYRLDGKGLDYLGNARRDPKHPTSPFVGVRTRPDGTPEVGANGCLVSTTALGNPLIANLDDPLHYVDSEVVPYFSLPPELKALGVDLGDVALMEFRSCGVPLIGADIGPHRKFGEVSIAAAKAASIPSSPKNGGIDGGVTFTIFPRSRTSPPWPRTPEDIAAQVAQLRAAA